MKIEKKYIIERCNLSHPDFGTFAAFLDGLGAGQSYIEIAKPDTVHICKECTRPLFLDTKLCLYCAGVEAANKKNPLLDHNHCFTIEDKPHCIKCGVYQKWLEDPSAQSSVPISIQIP